jgi:post-segregation antitoxin (ccd killing protein)
MQDTLSLLYDTTARRQTVSLTVNGDLYGKVRAAGLNASRIAESALAQALKAHEAEKLKVEIQKDIKALADYVAEHGDPVAEWREMFAAPDAA